MEYYKFISHYAIGPAPVNADLPDGSRAINIPAMPTAREVYASINCYPLEDTPMPEPVDGYYWEARYAVEDGVIKKTWEQVALPPVLHTYKKSYLAQWFYRMNLWSQFQTLLNASPDASFLWSVCTEFDSTDDRWPAIIESIKAGLSLTDEQVESLLYYGETGHTLTQENSSENLS